VDVLGVGIGDEKGDGEQQACAHESQCTVSLEALSRRAT
jgi:hypothetical protein